MTNTYAVEYTDTFGGEANYGWVRRADVDAPAAPYRSRAYRQTLMRRAKAAVGLTGVRGVTHDMGDGYEFRPYGMCTVMFVSWRDA
jgi:hypothetical protein